MNRLKRLLNTALSRVVLAGLFLLLQIAVLVVMVWAFQSYFVYFYGFCVLLSFFAALYVLNAKDNPAYKIAWIIPIIMFPVFGGLFYLVFGRSRVSKHDREKMKSVQQAYNDAFQGFDSAMDTLAQENPDAACQSRYLLNTARAPVYDHTESEYLPSGEIFFERLVEQLKTAKKFIFMEFFIIQEGVMWSAILEVLEEKAKQGVDVRVMYDDFGCLVTLPDNYDRMLEARGIKSCIFNRFVPVLSGRFNNRDHRKICVIDGNLGFTGGVNLADEYINAITKHGHWLDCGIFVRGEAVWSFTVMFLSLWNYVRGEAEDIRRFAPDPAFVATVPSDGYVQPYTDTPLDGEPVGENVYLNMINRACRYVYICTPYLIIDNEMITALCNAAKSGVDVRLLTPHIADKKPVHAVTRSHYPVLTEAGVRVFEYKPGFIHSKTFVCDDQYGVVGTINLDYRSLYLHFECATWLYGTKSVKHLRDSYVQTLERCIEVAPDACKKYNALHNLFLSILRVFSPLM